jgi:hypothetical protein
MRRLLTFILVAGLAVPAGAQSAADVKADMDAYKDEVNSALGTLSERIGMVEGKTGLAIKGDVRVRYEAFTQKGFNGLDGSPNRRRARVRLRIGAESKLGDWGHVGCQLATGCATDPTSTNQTLEGSFNRYDARVDKAFIQWAPKPFHNRLSLTGGKFANPLKTSAINYAGDINPEGFNVEIRKGRFTFKTGYWLLDEDSKDHPAAYDEYLWPSQILVAMPKVIRGVDWTFGAGYLFIPTFNYNTEAAVNGVFSGVDPYGSGNSGMLFPTAAMQAGSPMEFHNFSFTDFMLEFNGKTAGRDMKLTLHTVHNTNSFDLNRTTWPGLTGDARNNNENAYLIEIQVGKVGGPGQTAFGLRWGYLEPNGTFGPHADSDSEYNNRKYLRTTASLGLAKNLQCDVTGFGIKRVNYAVLAAETHEPLYRFQFDFVAKL